MALPPKRLDQVLLALPGAGGGTAVGTVKRIPVSPKTNTCNDETNKYTTCAYKKRLHLFYELIKS